MWLFSSLSASHPVQVEKENLRISQYWSKIEIYITRGTNKGVLVSFFFLAEVTCDTITNVRISLSLYLVCVCVREREREIVCG